MTTQFKDFTEIYEPLVLPIGGKEYTIAPPTFQVGQHINAVVDGGEKLDDEAFYRLLLSDAVFDQLIADQVSGVAIDRVARTALTDFKYGRELALTMWDTGGDPKAVGEYKQRNAANRAGRRAKTDTPATKAGASRQGN